MPPRLKKPGLKKPVKKEKQKRRRAHEQIPLEILPDGFTPRGERPFPKTGGPKVRLFSDLCGIESDGQALHGLGCDVEVLGACDKALPVQKLWIDNFADGEARFFQDILKRNHRSVKELGCQDVYTAGFSCQPFSTAGSKAGADDVRSEVIVHIIQTIQACVPKCFVLENVEGLVTQHPDVLTWLLKCLKSIGHKAYAVDAKLLNVKEHGIPHNRSRLLIVGQRKDCMLKKFEWPVEYGCVDMSDVLLPCTKPATIEDMPPQEAGVNHRNFMECFERIVNELHLNPLKSDIVADIDSTNPQFQLGISPCLTNARCEMGGHWVFSRGRRLHLEEVCRLFGLSLKNFRKPNAITERQFKGLCGNSIPLNILERVFLRLLPSMGICRSSDLVERWESLAQARVTMSSL